MSGSLNRQLESQPYRLKLGFLRSHDFQNHVEGSQSAHRVTQTYPQIEDLEVLIGINAVVVDIVTEIEGKFTTAPLIAIDFIVSATWY